MKKPVYLDYNATAVLLPEVRDVMVDVLNDVGNASAVHAFGRRARQQVEKARQSVADLVGAKATEIVFTSGGTEANNLALSGVDLGHLTGTAHVFTAATEHDSVLKACPNTTVLEVGSDGQIDLDALDRRLSGETGAAIVSVMAANNETGIIHDVERIADVARGRGALFHTDMVQAAGRLPLTVGKFDLATLTSHKLGGPQGIGALYVAEHVKLAPQMRGGGQERGNRAGTENVAAITGFGAAARHCAAQKTGDAQRLSALRDSMEQAVVQHVPRVVVIGQDLQRLPNTTCIALPGVKAETQVMMLDLDGIAVSAGSACSSGKVKASHVLTAMGLPENIAACAIRVSFGHQSTTADADRFVEAWTNMAKRTYKGGTTKAA